jgi:hypothetical protein
VRRLLRLCQRRLAGAESDSGVDGRWSRRWKAGEDNKDQLRKILEEVSAAPEQPKGTPSQLTGDYYAACTNVRAIDAADKQRASRRAI